jgi:uncharacterized membrane protein YgcG
MLNFHNIRLRKCLAVVFLLFAVGFWITEADSAFAQNLTEERVLSFQSDITVNQDGSMKVIETIIVNVSHKQIKHGIYRDFPTNYRDRLGNHYTVDFEVLSVQRDGRHEPYHFKDLSNGTRIYMGGKERLVDLGEHTYTLTYKTNRQLGFFKDFDELYWNVTGNGWDFVIEKAAASIELPPGAQGKFLSYEGYTGAVGSRGKDFQTTIDPYGRLLFTATRPLYARQGLTIAVSWPKGYVVRPSPKAKLMYFLYDNRPLLLGILGLFFLVLYYSVVWSHFGQDPAKGTIIPLFEPPDNISPQAMRYIMKMGYDHKIFSCALIQMAVKGFITVEEKDGIYTLKKTGKEISFNPEEAQIARILLPGMQITLQNENHDYVSKAILCLKNALKQSYDKIYFFTNIQYFIPGIVFSVIILLGSAFMQAGPKLAVAAFMSVWLTGWSFGVFMLLGNAFSAWRGFLSGGSRRASLLCQAFFISLFSIPFIIGEIVGIVVLVSATTIAIVPVLILMVLINLVFYHLLKAPTLAGRKVMDKIEGFKMYLSTAEKDRLDVLNEPDKTPEVFEKYLPYALALDVEQKWAEKFSEVLAKAGQEGRQYQPAWYSGSALNTVGAAGFISGFGSSLSGAIASSSVAPGSSSGSGGGGSSGGGGGGGGGGGW